EVWSGNDSGDVLRLAGIDRNRGHDRLPGNRQPRVQHPARPRRGRLDTRALGPLIARDNSPGSSRSGIDVGIAKDEVDVRRVDLGVNLDDGCSLVESAGGLLARGVVVNVDDSLGIRFVIDAGTRVDVQ